MSFCLPTLKGSGGENGPKISSEDSHDVSSIEFIANLPTTSERAHLQSGPCPSSKAIPRIGNVGETPMSPSPLVRLTSADSDTLVPSRGDLASDESSVLAPGLGGILKKCRTVQYQLVLVSITCLLGPGMWNALNGIGGTSVSCSLPSPVSNQGSRRCKSRQACS